MKPYFTRSSLAQAVYELYKKDLIHTDEFQSLIRVFGLEKIDALITEEQRKEIERERTKARRSRGTLEER